VRGVGYELLRKLRLADLPDELHVEVLAALNPYHARKADPPIATVRHVLGALVKVPEIKVDHHGGGYERIVKLSRGRSMTSSSSAPPVTKNWGGSPGIKPCRMTSSRDSNCKGSPGTRISMKSAGFLWEKMMGEGSRAHALRLA